MSSDDEGQCGPRSLPREFVLTVDQFEVLFQVTHQLPNFQESCLSDLGFTAADLQQLTTMLRGVDVRVSEASRVRILLCGDEMESVAELVATKGEVDEGDISPREVRATLPSRIAERWYELTRLVATALGSRELFLRTGYEPEEVEAAASILNF
jgi:hypothetical protein